MMPAATMTTMTNTAPIAVSQPKSDPAKMGMINNNRQGKPLNPYYLRNTYKSIDKFEQTLQS